MSLDFLYTGVSWVLLRWHDLFTFLGLSAAGGVNWSLSIIFLVITARLALFRFFLKQVHYQRTMQAMQPRLQAIREKYKNDRQAQQREMMRLQQERGFKPLAGCLPMLLQILIFIALFHVLRHVSNSASLCHPIQVQNAKLSLYGFTATQTCSAAEAKLFGAPLAGTLTNSRHTIESTLSGSYPSTLIVTIIVVFISAATTFYTQRLVKAGNPTQPAGTAATVQKLMAVGIPISVVISGLFFPLGVLIYWFTSNAWTMGQQLYINKFHPHRPPPDPAAGTGDEGPISPNGGHPTTPDHTPQPPAPRPGQRPTRPPRKRAPSQRKVKNKRIRQTGGHLPLVALPRRGRSTHRLALTSHFGRRRRILSSQPQTRPGATERFHLCGPRSARSAIRTTATACPGGRMGVPRCLLGHRGHCGHLYRPAA